MSRTHAPAGAGRQPVGQRRLAAALVLTVAGALSPVGHAAGQTAGPADSAPATNPLAGSALYADVQRYESFGLHRYGSTGAELAMAWIAERLRGAGLVVQDQRFSMARQYAVDAATLSVGDTTLQVLPQWWMPEAQASVSITAPIAPDGDGNAQGRFVRLRVPYDQGAYLNQRHRAAVATALARRPAAVLMQIDHPSGEIFTYNVAQDDAPWSAPVILVAPKDAALLDAAQAAGTPLALSVLGRHVQNVAGRNVVGRLDRGSRQTVVVSTPVTSWFASTCERGPGIAAFLALTRVAASSLPGVNLLFVATAGHEIGHGGMDEFIRTLAPPPDAVAAWLHLGASLACYGRVRDGERWAIKPEVDASRRFIGMSAGLAPVIEPALRGVAATRVQGERAAVGELRNIHEAGYPRYFGMLGTHALFHTPQDSAAMTGPAALEAVVVPLAEALRAAAAARP